MLLVNRSIAVHRTIQHLTELLYGDARLTVLLRAPDKMRIFIPIKSNSKTIPMFDHLIESSQLDDSNKWSNIGFG